MTGTARAKSVLKKPQPCGLSHFGTEEMQDIKLQPKSVLAIDAALRRVREAEAAHYESRLTFTDAKLLRLAQLWDDLGPIFAAAPAALVAPELATPPGGEPRLWVDLVTSVVMAPDPKTFRLIRDAEEGRDILCESTERTDVIEAVRTYLMHRCIAAARQTPPPAPPAIPAAAVAAPGKPPGYLIAITAGFALGALAAMILVMSMKL